MTNITSNIKAMQNMK